MRVLVICDDYWHPARVPRAGLAPLAGGDFDFGWIESAAEWSAVLMAEFPLVLLTKSNNVSSSDQNPWMTADIEQAFCDYVRAGNGLLAIHSGTAGYEDASALRSLLGGVFKSHPAQCPVTVAPNADHQLSAGSAPFTLTDEHYMMAMGANDIDIFLTTTSEHGEQPAGWTRREDAGRVCVLTPGHNLEVWLHPSYQVLIGNALHWCGGEED